MTNVQFPPESFNRQDERPDTSFYEMPRLVNHIDDYAIAAWVRRTGASCRRTASTST